MKLTALILVPLALAATLMTSHCMIVSVHEGGADGTNIVVPVPLVFAQAVLAVTPMPDEVRELRVPPEAERWLPVAGRLLEHLEGVPDAVLVSVEEGDERVMVRKAGDSLLVDVEDGDERVHVRVPVGAVADIVDKVSRGDIHPRHLVSALRQAPRGRLVHVRDGQDEVKISVY